MLDGHSQRRERPGLSIVIPAYNEEHRLPRTLDELWRYREGFDRELEILVCDDGSTDGTAVVVEARADSMQGLRLVRLPHRGKGSAVRGGMLAATLPYVMLCDADLSMPVEELDLFVEVLDSGCQIAVGSRELPDSKRYHEPARRHVMGRVFNLVVKLLLAIGMNDTQCGFKAFRREVARDLFSRQKLDGFSFDAEVLFLARKRHYSTKEVAINWYFNDDSRVRAVSDTFAMTLDLLRVRLQDLRGDYRQAAKHLD
ncbi:MAG: putative glycosyltransferase [Chloroflexi bacterium]|jgi:dolichyl-phosphate beta-glucosyltransferase|nr:putative glycosyltransferase [Chloroflexota bacterium]